MADTCPLLVVQPILSGQTPSSPGQPSMPTGILAQLIKRAPNPAMQAGAITGAPAGGEALPRTLQYNFTQIVEWTQQLCSYIATLEARIAALEAAP